MRGLGWVAVLGLLAGQAEAQQVRQTTRSTVTQQAGKPPVQTTSRSTTVTRPSAAAIVGGAVLGGAVAGAATAGTRAASAGPAQAPLQLIDSVPPIPGFSDATAERQYAASQAPRFSPTATRPVTPAEMAAIIAATAGPPATGRERPGHAAAMASRAQRLCAEVPVTVFDWPGEFRRSMPVAPNGTTLAVTVGQNITLRSATLNMAESAPAFISNSGDVARAAAGIQPGQAVTISGIFITRADRDCFRDVSATEAEQAQRPSFLFRFTAIQPR